MSSKTWCCSILASISLWNTTAVQCEHPHWCSGDHSGAAGPKAADEVYSFYEPVNQLLMTVQAWQHQLCQWDSMCTFFTKTCLWEKATLEQEEEGFWGSRMGVSAKLQCWASIKTGDKRAATPSLSDAERHQEMWKRVCTCKPKIPKSTAWVLEWVTATV